MSNGTEYARFPSPDTTLAAARVYYEIIARLTPAQRIARMLEMDRESEALAAAGIRHRHPHYDQRQVWLALTRMRLGPELFNKAFPGH